MRRLLLLAVAGATLAARPARGAEPFGSLSLGVAYYLPNIDSEFAGRSPPVQPYYSSFGSSRALMFQGIFSKTLWATQVGTLDLGFGAGYWEVYGHGVAADGTTGDTTSMQIIPLSLSVGYRVDWFMDQVGVPFAPYGRASFLDYLWTVKNGSGSTASYQNPSTSQVVRGSGATYGYGFTAGLALDLNFIDPKLAREMYTDTGIRHSLLYAEGTWSFLDDFGSRKSWVLSSQGTMWGFGLAFVF